MLWYYTRKPRPTAAASGLFLMLYGLFRILVEFVRVPDEQIGYLAFGWVTMGQLLSVPMVMLGAVIRSRSRCARGATRTTRRPRTRRVRRAARMQKKAG